MIKNLTIRTQLILGFAGVLLFVILIGSVAYSQTAKLHAQTETMYEHPLQVRRAIAQLNSDILANRIAVNELMFAKDDGTKNEILGQIELSSQDAGRQLDIFADQYLGPEEDVKKARENFYLWTVMRDNVIAMALAGQINEAEASMLWGGPESSAREKMLESIKTIDAFSMGKGNELHQISITEKETLDNQLAILLISIVFLIFIIIFFLLKTIIGPLKEMNAMVLAFDGGNLKARIGYRSKNELGVLSSSINAMADTIAKSTDLGEKASNFTKMLLANEELNQFFRLSLSTLAQFTNAHMAAVYLLNDNKKTFDIFESIGMPDKVKQSFVADQFEGEFGMAAVQGTPQIIRDIPEDTRFLFYTVNGQFVPKEIITIPIIAKSETIGVISMATVTGFNSETMDFIENISFAMNARIQSILAYAKIKEIMEELEKQNFELSANKTELSAQTAELMQQNTELEMQKNQLDEASRLKTNFLSNMSHELRTPLNSVIALSGVLNRRLNGKIPEEEYNYLEIIERNGKNLLLLINDILDISRIEAGKEEMEVVTFNMNHLVDEVILMIKPQADQKDIELRGDFPMEELHLFSDYQKCRHILQNLIGNAVKFTDKGGVIVATEKTQEGIRVAVTDTGIGISEEAQEHIFDEFRQADGSTSRRFGGTGLGLAIAKKYANLLGATITVSSHLNEGSCFTLDLPLRYDEERIIEETRPMKPVKSLTTIDKMERPEELSPMKNILIVDDNESAIIQIDDLVRDLGYSTLTASDAKEAFQIIDRVVPDAMVLDLMMPDVDGFKVLQTLRNAEATAHIPVLVLTAKHITKEDLKVLKRNNIHQLIQKGDVDRKKLETAINTMLFPQKMQEISLDPVPQNCKEVNGKPVVLVVEDNPDNMTTVRALLAENYRVIEATDGKEAIEKAKEGGLDLVLMDIALPGINGIEAFLEIRKMPKNSRVPVIALTASAMEKDREAVLSHGFDAFIPKPIIAKEFFKIIEEVLYGK